MAQAPEKIKPTETHRPQQAKPSASESLARMEEFKARKEKFIATIQKSED